MTADIVRQAKAIVYFRLLRSIGCFYAIKGTRHFVYKHCRCCASYVETLPNGLPAPAQDCSPQEIVKEYSHELGPLCQEMLDKKA